MSSYTPEDEEEVLRAYRANPSRFSAFKVSKTLGLHINAVFEIVENNREALNRIGERFAGYGRPELRQHLVARRRPLGAPWDNREPKIADARAKHEAGTHIMATGRDGSWLLLYSIPRTGRPQPLPGYFNMDRA